MKRIILILILILLLTTLCFSKESPNHNGSGAQSDIERALQKSDIEMALELEHVEPIIFPPKIKTISNEHLKATITYEVSDSSVALSIRVSSNHYSDKGSLWISFPQLRTEERIVQQLEEGFLVLENFEANRKVWSDEYQRSIYTAYLLIEGRSKQWNRGETKEILLAINSEKLDFLVVNIRVTLDQKNGEYLLPTKGETDQQGYACYQLHIPVKKRNL